ncbi:MAG: hypothetical protein HGA65_05880, partial [Oscillochloris sp.]|nr:hypothetical protein [Oscillochloris sp.]
AAASPPPSSTQIAAPPSIATTISQVNHQHDLTTGQGDSFPWIITIVLALLVGGMAVALGFLLINRQGDAVAGSTVGGDSSTPTGTPSPTSLPTKTSAATADTGGVANSTAVRSPTVVHQATARPNLPTTVAAIISTATATTSPTASPTDTAVPTVTATPTASTPPTATATATVDCTEGMLNGGFGQLYREDVVVRERLGCPESIDRAGDGATQFFQSGTMFYWGLNPTNLRDSIVIFYGLNTGNYQVVSAEETASYPEAPASEDPNTPIRGFGRVYYGKSGVATGLGTWKSPELELKGSTRAVIQFFESGTMIYIPIYNQPGASAQSIFVLYADGTFERYNDPSIR